MLQPSYSLSRLKLPLEQGPSKPIQASTSARCLQILPMTQRPSVFSHAVCSYSRLQLPAAAASVVGDIGACTFYWLYDAPTAASFVDDTLCSDAVFTFGSFLSTAFGMGSITAEHTFVFGDAPAAAAFVGGASNAQHTLHSLRRAHSRSLGSKHDHRQRILHARNVSLCDDHFKADIVFVLGDVFGSSPRAPKSDLLPSGGRLPLALFERVCSLCTAISCGDYCSCLRASMVDRLLWHLHLCLVLRMHLPWLARASLELPIVETFGSAVFPLSSYGSVPNDLKAALRDVHGCCIGFLVVSHPEASEAATSFALINSAFSYDRVCDNLAYLQFGRSGGLACPGIPYARRNKAVVTDGLIRA